MRVMSFFDTEPDLKYSSSNFNNSGTSFFGDGIILPTPTYAVGYSAESHQLPDLAGLEFGEYSEPSVNLQGLVSEAHDFIDMAQIKNEVSDPLAYAVEVKPHNNVDYSNHGHYDGHNGQYDEREMPDLAYLSSGSPQSSCSTSHHSSSVQPAPRSSTSTTTGCKRKRLDKDSDEYRRRREQNNKAVKKSREKAKADAQLVKERVSRLSRENDDLEKQVKLLGQKVHDMREYFARIKPEIPEEMRIKIDRFFATTS